MDVINSLLLEKYIDAASTATMGEAVPVKRVVQNRNHLPEHTQRHIADQSHRHRFV
jgi:hypothetical protein